MPERESESAAVDAAASAEEVAESIRLQAEEHPLIYETAPQTVQEKVLTLIHLRAYQTARALTAGRDVLDLGCNTGYGTVHLVGGGARSITGADVSPAAIAAARGRPAADQIDFRVVDGQALPFADASFDLVTSFQVIEHVVDTRSYLLEILRVLRPGGKVVFTTPNAAIRLDPGMKPINPFHVREYLAPEFEAELAAVFPEVEVFGMFAVPTLYEVELDRTDTARRTVRGRLEREAAAAAAAEAAAVAAAEREAAAERAAAESAAQSGAEPVATGSAVATPGALRRFRRRLGKTRVGTAALVLLGRAPAQQRPVVVVAAPPPPPPPAAPAPPPPPPAGPVHADLDMTPFDLGDLYYARHDLDRSLDLMAVCSLPVGGAG